MCKTADCKIINTVLSTKTCCDNQRKGKWGNTSVRTILTLSNNPRGLPTGFKSKGIPRQAEVAQGVPGRLRPRIFSTFGTTRVVGSQPNAPAAFTPGEIPGTHFQKLSRPQGTWFCRKEPRKKILSDTTGDRSRDRPTSSAAPKPLHYPRSLHRF